MTGPTESDNPDPQNFARWTAAIARGQAMMTAFAARQASAAARPTTRSASPRPGPR